MRRKLLTLCVTLFLALACSLPAFALEPDLTKTGSICVTLTEQYEKTPICRGRAELVLHCHRRCQYGRKLNYICTEAFAETGIPIDDPELATKLDLYLFDNEAPMTLRCTDAQGMAVWEQLPLGMYFVRQTGLVDGFAPCTPFLVTVPMAEAEGYVYEVNATPKTEVAKLTEITIKKVWNTDASTKAADSVTVELLRDGKLLETAVLNEENNWQVVYPDMAESDGYSIREVNVPNGFTATYKQKGYVFTVTNTSTLIQTGQVTWPIPVLAILGMLLIGAGTALMQKKRAQDA